MNENVNYSAIEAITVYEQKFNSFKQRRVAIPIICLIGVIIIYVFVSDYYFKGSKAFEDAEFLDGLKSPVIKGETREERRETIAGLKTQGYLGTLICPGIGLFGVILLVTAVMKNKTSLDDQLAAHEDVNFAEYGNPKEVAAAISVDLAKNSKQIGSLSFGSEFFVIPSPLDAWRYDDLVWVFYDSTSESALIIKSVDHLDGKIATEEEQANQAISEILKHAPLIKTTFDEDLLKKWDAIKRWKDEREKFKQILIKEGKLRK